MMESNESEERVVEGLKKAVSCAKQLARAQKSKSWMQIAAQLEAMLMSAKELMKSGQITHVEAAAMIDKLIAKKVLQNGSEGVN